jgi:hypothetical protein
MEESEVAMQSVLIDGGNHSTKFDYDVERLARFDRTPISPEKTMWLAKLTVRDNLRLS